MKTRTLRVLAVSLMLSALTLPAAPAPARHVSAAVGDSSGMSFPERLRAVRSLRGCRLSEPQAQKLWECIAAKPDLPFHALARFNQLRNEIARVLVAHSPPLPDTVERLCTMHEDTSYDRTWRDYCIQFLGRALPRITDQAARERCCRVLFQAAAHPSSPTAGTALIALADNIDVAKPISRGEVVRYALRAAENERNASGARLTAFQICARLGAREALAPARRAAAGEGLASVSVRMSALAIIGALGGDADKAMLTKLTRSADARLRRASAVALRRLDGDG